MWGYLPCKPRLRFWSKSTIFKSFDNRSKRQKGILSSIHVSVGSLILSSIYPLFPHSTLLCSATCRSPNFFLVLQSVDLGVALSSNRRYSPRCQSFVLRVFFRLRALRCDETVPKYVSSLHGRLDFRWAVLRSRSRNRWLVLDGLVVFSLRSWLTDDATIHLLSVRPMLLCTWPLWWTWSCTVEV